MVWDHEYDITIFTENGKSYKYEIEADTATGAKMVAKEFFVNDCPNETIKGIQIKRER